MPETLAQLFLDAVDRYTTKQAALRYKVSGRWRDLTHAALARRVHHAALGLRELGIERSGRVALLSENRPEWAVVDFACLTIGAVTVPIYPNLPADQVAYLLRDARCAVVVVEDAEQWRKVESVRPQLPDLRHVVVIEPTAEMTTTTAFDAMVQFGAAAEPKYPTYHEDARAFGADTLATIIYTSGTTGEPKGVMLTHGNLVSNVVACTQALPIDATDTCLSLLPLSHALERTAGHFVMFHQGVTIAYAESIDAVPANLLEVRPTVMVSVPRLYEKMYARVLERALGSALRRRMFYWARRTGDEWTDLTLSGEPIPVFLAARYRLAHRLVFAKLRARTGGRLRYFVSGGAPLLPDIARFFLSAGLPILEGYGLTETAPVIAVNPLDAPRLGTVGRPLNNLDVRIADDGEILVRGPSVMVGYLDKPRETAEVLDDQGWLYTGDIGELTPDGYLRITDRKKDMIVTAGGKNIAPQPIENRVKTSPFVVNAVMLGDRRKFPVLLVVPNFDTMRAWAAERNVPTGDAGAMLAQPDLRAKVEREVMLTVRHLANYERPKKVLLVAEDFTVENGALTPTLKVKRRVVEDRYRAAIDALYEEPPPDDAEEDPSPEE